MRRYATCSIQQRGTGVLRRKGYWGTLQARAAGVSAEEHPSGRRAQAVARVVRQAPVRDRAALHRSVRTLQHAKPSAALRCVMRGWLGSLGPCPPSVCGRSHLRPIPLAADPTCRRCRLRPIPLAPDPTCGRSHLRPIPLAADPTCCRSHLRPIPLAADPTCARSHLRPIPLAADPTCCRSHLRPIPLAADPTCGRSRLRPIPLAADPT